MKPIRTIAILALTTLTSIGVNAQNRADVKLNHKSSTNKQVCFDIEIRSAEKKEIPLAGQNYRLFYDASKLKYSEDNLVYRLSQEAYSDMEVLEDGQNNIGFISLSVDGMARTPETITLSREGEWHNVASVCFDKLTDRDFDIVWADESTANFASAQVALSEWKDDEEQIVVLPNLLMGYSSLSQIDSKDAVSLQLYPNPLASFLNVDLSTNQVEGYIAIRDVIGREVVYEQITAGGAQHYTYDLTNWPSGRYTVELINDKGVLFADSVIKVDKQK